jgi:hypothetical protein
MPISSRADIAALNTPFVGLMDPMHGPISAQNVAIVVAHPDDETIGCGALLSRLNGCTVILVTDGAPRNLMDAQAHGFTSTADYAAWRAVERFRLAPPYDFAELPNGGSLHYENQKWCMEGECWCVLAREARAQLDLEGRA